MIKTKREKIIDDQESDKFDGLKAIGCLFAGIILIAIFLSVAGFLISQIRPPL